MTHYERNESAMCADCGHDCRSMSELFMLHDELWHDICMADRATCVSMLCVGCAETRLGRPLYGFDFTDCPLNDAVFGQSLRLRRALKRAAA